MADYYNQFSFVISGLTKKERKWMEELLQLEENEIDKIKEAIGPEAGFYADADEDLYMMWPFFEYEFVATGKEIDLFISTTDHGSFLQAALVAHAYMRHFHKDGVLKLSVAYVCSKARTDGFGGETCFVTKNSIFWMEKVTEMVEAVLSSPSKHELFEREVIVSVKRK